MKAVVVCIISVLVATGAFAESQSSVTPSSSPAIEISKLDRAKEILREEKASKEHPTSEASTPEGLGLKMIAGLLLSLGVLSIMVFAAKKLQRSGGFGGGKKIMVLERAPLGPKTSLVLAEIEGQKVLLSVGSERVTLLHKIAPPFEVLESGDSTDLNQGPTL